MVRWEDDSVDVFGDRWDRPYLWFRGRPKLSCAANQVDAVVTLDIRKANRELVAKLRAEGTAAGDPKLAAYVGSPYPVLGLPVPQMRSILRDFKRENRKLAAREMNALAGALWSGPTYEEKSIAIALLDAFPKIRDNVSWKIADRWVDEAIGWGLSDALAGGPIAEMVYETPSRFTHVMRWTGSTHFWRRRASAYAMHDFVLAGDLDKPLQLLEKLLYDDEFWVQRAVGTWLRESWKQDSRRTEAFLRKHAAGLPKVVITVATERSSKAFRDELRRER